tara:strand:- start:91 stop:666 length:576 start_codon:yes stop_codon:yes gene_type:complete
VSKLLEVHPKNVIVTGTVGAEISAVALLLVRQGWRCTYEGQDLEVFDGRNYERYGFNIEVDRIHEMLGERNSRFSKSIPDYFEPTYPGPLEFVSNFKGAPAVISSHCIAPRLDAWVPAADIVVCVQASELEGMQSLASSGVPEGLRSEIRDHQLNKLAEHLKLFPKVFTMTNAEVKDSRFDVLSSFLNSVF